MSLYERFCTWLSRDNNLRQAECPWSEGCVFWAIPRELYFEIFKNLDIVSLKACKEVCFPWTDALYQSGLLPERTITTWNIDGFSIKDNTKLIYDLIVGNIDILDVGFRLYEIGRANFLAVSIFGLNDAFEHVTHLELIRCHIGPISIILFAFRNVFKSVVSLIMNDVYIGTVEGDELSTESLTLKTLKIIIKDKWESQHPNRRSRVCPTPEFSTDCCIELQDYSLEFFDSTVFHFPVPPIDPRFGAFLSALDNSCRALMTNVKTLKSFTIKTFDIEDDRAIGGNQTDHEQVKDWVDVLFRETLGVLEHFFPNLDFSDLHLEKLILHFRLIQIGTPECQRILMPFLRSQTALKQFSLSQVFFPGDGGVVTQELQNSLPENCRTTLEGVMTVRPTFLPDDGVEDNIQFPIRGYFDSTVEFITARVNLTLRFISCDSLEDINFFGWKLPSLTKIKIQQPGARFANKIIIRDADMQRIIRGAPHLTELWLEFCNLAATTDFGLTGISPEACTRMSLTRDFELRDGDQVGSPISAINKLRSLNLSTVGNHVTDVTAYHAFSGLGSLIHFGISNVQMTPDGIGHLKRLFQFNQVVQFEAQTKFLLDNTSITEPENPIELNP